jgi:hypothetical protein
MLVVKQDFRTNVNVSFDSCSLEISLIKNLVVIFLFW